MTFEKAVEFVLEQEGGYVNNPQDPGGETNFGISKRAYPNLDIANLTKDKASQIYKEDYWDRLSCAQLPNGLDLLVFDAAVNEGPDRAAKILQLVLGVKQDGVIGPATINATRNATSIVTDYLAQRMYQYALIPQILTFGHGWYRRLAMAAQLAFGA